MLIYPVGLAYQQQDFCAALCHSPRSDIRQHPYAVHLYTSSKFRNITHLHLNRGIYYLRLGRSAVLFEADRSRRSPSDTPSTRSTSHPGLLRKRPLLHVGCDSVMGNGPPTRQSISDSGVKSKPLNTRSASVRQTLDNDTKAYVEADNRIGPALGYMPMRNADKPDYETPGFATLRHAKPAGEPVKRVGYWFICENKLSSGAENHQCIAYVELQDVDLWLAIVHRP